ncbi:toxin-antitoxin system YwqK family antitoxin [Flavivirga spongiicola]|uniref:MORN repeat protein n=1 Tax=Flavivirga spongiicola TaxID=421621 RepID=A0ABU7XQU6_9FLAO|nr:hypothetical protein [Flavivirga sp. MEBiC05379]MDO5978159.1 hypothetical protein [Flavivirga sp. MEBiC05379]
MKNSKLKLKQKDKLKLCCHDDLSLPIVFRRVEAYFFVNAFSKNYTLLTLYMIFFFTLSVCAQELYKKTYYDNGNIKSEGWISNNKKIKYWTFYYSNGRVKKEGHFQQDKPIKYWYFYVENGKKKSEGHFINGKKNNWWLFYDTMEKINHKCQLKDNQKNGYCLMYKNEKLVSARKYKAGKKIKEWTDYRSFRKENKLSDLQ